MKKIIITTIAILLVGFLGFYFYTNSIEPPSKEDVGLNIDAKPEMYDVWDGTVATAFSEGKGTIEDPYLISTGAELALFSSLINEGSDEHIDACYCLINSIDLNGYDWKQIGYSTYKEQQVYENGSYVIKGRYTYGCAFEGVFEGKNCVIKNFKITQSDNEMTGFFGDLNGAVVRNLGLEEYTISIERNTEKDVCVGGITGLCRAGAQIKGCYTTGDISASSTSSSVSVGGIVGNSIEGCVVEKCFSIGDAKAIYRANPMEGYSNDGAYAGGIVACNNGRISNCYSKGNIRAYTNAGQVLRSGGIAAINGDLLEPEKALVENCYSTGKISAGGGSFAYIGGLIALNSAKVQNCFALGEVRADVYSENSVFIGGTVGISSSGGTVQNCYRLDAQTVASSADGTVVCDAGIPEELEIVKSVAFQRGTLGFGDEWSLSDNCFPNLIDLPKTAIITYSGIQKALLCGQDFFLGTSERLGYVFKGWEASGVLITDDVGDKVEGYMLAGDVNASARYEPILYSIIYHGAENANQTNPTVYDIEDTPLILKDAEKANHSFLGWYADADFVNRVFEIADGTIGEIHLYAKWESLE